MTPAFIMAAPRNIIEECLLQRDQPVECCNVCIQFNDAWVLSNKDQLSFNRSVFVATRDRKATVIGRKPDETI